MPNTTGSKAGKEAAQAKESTTENAVVEAEQAIVEAATEATDTSSKKKTS